MKFGQQLRSLSRTFRSAAYQNSNNLAREIKQIERNLNKVLIEIYCAAHNIFRSEHLDIEHLQHIASGWDMYEGLRENARAIRPRDIG